MPPKKIPVNNKKVAKKSSAPARKNTSPAQPKTPPQENYQAMYANMMNLFLNSVPTLNNGPIIDRTGLAGRLGSQFDGDRQLYDTFGYPATLDYTHYRAMYERHGMATRVVEKFSNDTWNRPPVIIDGDSRSDIVGEETTPFLTQWNALSKKLQIWQVMREADIMCGIGRYSILFLGSSGDFKQPVTGQGGLFYLAAYDENQAKIKSYISDRKNEMYGLPEYYTISMQSFEDNSLENTRQQIVHHSRCIHVSENRLGSRVFGRPRLQEVFNRLMDLEKVTGGGAEAAWLAVYMGFLILTREGTELPEETSTEWQEAEEAIQKFAHRIQRFATLKGVESVVNLGVHEVRIKDIYETLISDLAGTKGIPQRILLGSERGELASSQDMREWNGVIDSRRTNFAQPEILDPFIKFCTDSEILPEPSAGEYTVEWAPVYTKSEQEEAEFASKVAQGAHVLTLNNGTNALDINEFRGMVHLPPKVEEELVEEEEEREDVLEAKAKVGEEEVPPTNGKVSKKDKELIKENL